jgi:hypothetical protein
LNLENQIVEKVQDQEGERIRDLSFEYQIVENVQDEVNLEDDQEGERIRNLNLNQIKFRIKL